MSKVQDSTQRTNNINKLSSYERVYTRSTTQIPVFMHIQSIKSQISSSRDVTNLLRTLYSRKITIFFSLLFPSFRIPNCN